MAGYFAQMVYCSKCFRLTDLMNDYEMARKHALNITGAGYGAAPVLARNDLRGRQIVAAKLELVRSVARTLFVEGNMDAEAINRAAAEEKGLGSFHA